MTSEPARELSKSSSSTTGQPEPPAANQPTGDTRSDSDDVTASPPAGAVAGVSRGVAAMPSGAPPGKPDGEGDTRGQAGTPDRSPQPSR